MLAKQIQKGTSAKASGANWGMEASLCSLENTLRESLAVIFHHVRRKVNGVADALANHAVQQEEEVMERQWEDIHDTGLKE